MHQTLKPLGKLLMKLIRGSPAQQQYSLNVGGEIVRDLDKLCDLFPHHFSKIGKTVQSEAAVNKELLIEEYNFEVILFLKLDELLTLIR